MKTKIYLILVLLLWLPLRAESQVLKIADFDRGEKPNLISGDFGSWNKTEWDRSQFCNETFITDPRIVYGGRGCSLQLDYDVDSPREAYNGFWMRLEKIDLTKYKNFVFYVRGEERRGFTSRFKIELKSIKGDIARFEVNGVTSEWKKVTIPLDKLLKEGDFSEGYEFTIVFEDRFVSKKVGRIYIDEIYLE